jgi:4-hydroxybenzoate polyprenyltransferase
MALVFTAVADGWCTLLLAAQRRAELRHSTLDAQLDARHFLAAAAVSVGLYGFGMSLNDIIDRRRDRQLAAHRPIPSGRIPLGVAHFVCASLLLLALLSGGYLAHFTLADGMGFLLLVWTILLIVFYDTAGKYLVAPGLLTLGLIRFFHATVPVPKLPLLWHPLWLLNHVAILSAVAYVWEQKRPPLTRNHWWVFAAGLATIDLVLIFVVGLRRQVRTGTDLITALRIGPELLPVVAATVAFVVFAFVLRKRFGSSPRSGQALVLYGLLWLIVYDACFVAGYVGVTRAALLLLLLPIAYFSVQLMRGWSKIVSLSQAPTYQRAK